MQGLAVLILALCLSQITAFSAHRAGGSGLHSSPVAERTIIGSATHQRRRSALRMSDAGGGGGGGSEKEKSTSKGLTTIVIDETDTEMEEEDIPEEMWRVVLHNDEVHTFNYVIRSLQKVMGTLDKKKAFDICTVTHGIGQATVTSCWKEQAMKYCLGLQRQGLTASIAPDSKFEGGGKGGDGGGGGGGGS
mmetsp:Transcript_29743/g.70697  ORF Transcript_29743/g.70697 Transcript_29743/m.70697 type:complete len:191 (+) Transcript_29743:78-650(+)